MAIPISNESVEAFYTAFNRDTVVFKRLLPKMMKEYPGHYVAIHNGQVLDHNRSWDELMRLAKSKHPNDYVLIEQVSPLTTSAINIDSMDT